MGVTLSDQAADQLYQSIVRVCSANRGLRHDEPKSEIERDLCNHDVNEAKTAGERLEELAYLLREEDEPQQGQVNAPRAPRPAMAAHKRRRHRAA